MKFCLLPLFGLLTLCASSQSAWLLVGTYTKGKSEGIYVYNFDQAKGSTALKSKIKSSNPAFLAVSADRKFVYAVNENGNDTGAVSAYRFNPQTASLSYINQQKSMGDNPCYVATDASGKWVAIANYSGGSLAIFPRTADGGLGPVNQFIQHAGKSKNQGRQEKAHVHSTFFSADNRQLFVPDLGMDKLMIYDFDEKTGKLKAGRQPFVVSPDFGGPRHIAFSPGNRYAYLMEELSGQVVAYKYQHDSLQQIQLISAAAPGFNGFMGSADIHISPDGKFLYCSNRGDANTITIFSIHPGTGLLSVVAHQSTMGTAPRNFSIDPSGNFLLVANQNSDNVVIFKRDKKTGLLTDTGKRIDVGNPVCLKWIVK